MPLLETEKLVKEFRHRRVVNGVSITVEPGEIVGLLVPNGAGKTTTFNMVVGVVKPDGGHARLDSTRPLVTSPQLLPLDEPFDGIEPIAVYEVQKIVRRLNERGLGILITDHSAREMLKLVDRAYLIFKGEVVYEGPADQLVND